MKSKRKLKGRLLKWPLVVSLAVTVCAAFAALIIKSQWWVIHVVEVSDARLVINSPEVQLFSSKTVSNGETVIEGQILLARNKDEAEQFRKASSKAAAARNAVLASDESASDQASPKESEDGRAPELRPVRASVELYVNHTLADKQETDRDGNFKFEAKSLRHGSNYVELVATAAQGWRKVSESESGFIDVKADSPSVLDVRDLPEVVHQPDVEIAGLTDRDTNVRVELLGAGQQTPEQTAEVRSDPFGRFETTIRLKHPGDYIVTLRTAGEATSHDAGRFIKFKYDPLLVAKAHGPLTRTVVATLSYKKLHLDIEAKFEKDDPLALSLMKGEVLVEQFVYTVFGFTDVVDGLHGRSFSGMFEGASPKFTYDSTSLTVSLSSNPSRESVAFLPALGGRITFRSLFSSDGTLHDSFKLKVEDYTPSSFYPHPDSVEGNVYIWDNQQERNVSPFKVDLQLTYRPGRSLLSFLRVFSLSPFQMFDWPEKVIFILLYGVWSAIPMLWLLWFLEDDRRTRFISPAALTPLRTYARGLLALCLTSPVLGLVNFLFLSARFGLYRLWSGALSTEVYHFLISIVVSIAILALYLPTLFPYRAERGFIHSLARGFRDASLLSVAVNFLTLLLTYLATNTFVHQYFTFLLALPLLWPLFFWPRRLLRVLGEGTVAGRKVFAAAAVLIWLAVAFPLRLAASYQPEDVESLVNSYKDYFWPIVQELAPYFLAFGIILLLRQARRDDVLRLRGVQALGYLLFACYLVGTTPTLLALPVSLLIAVWLFRNSVTVEFSKWRLIDRRAPSSLPERRALLKQMLRGTGAEKFREGLDHLDRKAAAGELSPREYEARRREFEEYIAWHERDTYIGRGPEARALVVGIGPFESNWSNGVWAAKHGLVLTLPLVVVYLFGVLQQEGWAQNPYILIWLSARLVTVLINWTLGAFFFGYFYEYIRGDKGLKKGTVISASIIASLLPSWLGTVVSVPDLAALLLRAGQTFLFFAALGMWAFDYRIFRHALREQYTWKKLFQFERLPSLTALSSVLVSSVGIAVTSVLNGWLPSILALLLGAGGANLPFQQNQSQREGPPGIERGKASNGNEGSQSR